MWVPKERSYMIKLILNDIFKFIVTPILLIGLYYLSKAIGCGFISILPLEGLLDFWKGHPVPHYFYMPVVGFIILAIGIILALIIYMFIYMLIDIYIASLKRRTIGEK